MSELRVLAKSEIDHLTVWGDRWQNPAGRREGVIVIIGHTEHFLTLNQAERLAHALLRAVVAVEVDRA